MVYWRFPVPLVACQMRTSAQNSFRGRTVAMVNKSGGNCVAECKSQASSMTRRAWSWRWALGEGATRTGAGIRTGREMVFRLRWGGSAQMTDKWTGVCERASLCAAEVDSVLPLSSLEVAKRVQKTKTLSHLFRKWCQPGDICCWRRTQTKEPGSLEGYGGRILKDMKEKRG